MEKILRQKSIGKWGWYFIYSYDHNLIIIVNEFSSKDYSDLR